MVRQLIDPRLRNGIPDHWSSLCTIQDKVCGVSASNQKSVVTYNDVAGQVNLPCRLGSLKIAGQVAQSENRTDKTTTIYDSSELLINAYLPDVQVRDQVVVIDGARYQIRGMDNDSQKFLTRLRVEIVD